MTSKVTVYTRKMSGEIYTLLSVNALFPIYSNILDDYNFRKKYQKAGRMANFVGQLQCSSKPRDIWSNYEELRDPIHKNGILNYRENDYRLGYIHEVTGFSGVE